MNGPACAKCGKEMTPQNSRLRPELFTCDDCFRSVVGEQSPAPDLRSMAAAAMRELEALDAGLRDGDGQSIANARCMLHQMIEESDPEKLRMFVAVPLGVTLTTLNGRGIEPEHVELLKAWLAGSPKRTLVIRCHLYSPSLVYEMLEDNHEVARIRTTMRHPLDRAIFDLIAHKRHDESEANNAL